jgi:hypothetical protein
VLPAGLTKETFRLAELFLLGTSVSGAPAITKITSLAQGELNSMFLKRLSTTVCVLALAAAIFFGASPASNLVGLRTIARADTILFDDFNDGNATDGSPWTWRPWTEGGTANGTFDASTGDLVLTPQSGNNTLAAVLQPAVNLADLSIRTQLSNTGANNPDTQGTGFVVRGDSSANLRGYDCGIDTDGLVYMLSHGPFAELANAPTDLRPLEEDVVLQLDLIGTSLKLFAWRSGEPMPLQPQVQVSSKLHSSGTIGIYYNPSPDNGSATFRYVHIADMSIPEPSSFVLGSLGAVAVTGLAIRLRRLGVC